MYNPAVNNTTERRGFLRRLFTTAGIAAAVPAAQAQPQTTTPAALPLYARARDYRSLKQSSFDPTGGNHDFWAIPAGGVREVFRAEGPGVITHIWFTIAARSTYHDASFVDSRRGAPFCDRVAVHRHRAHPFHGTSPLVGGRSLSL